MDYKALVAQVLDPAVDEMSQTDILSKIEIPKDSSKGDLPFQHLL
ncbi:Uncharacterised protein [Weissella viridescens]|uniref:Uncharacterized protein n=1 Tax=Weissella viridescens TaxID=1629 RepID=A0A380P3K3_WEIVI|nr:Uncharacterised protein [Weissella viridescens]